MTAGRVNVVIVGDDSVGKQSLVNCYLGEEFLERTSPLCHIKVDTRVVSVDGRKVELSLRNTPGTEDYDRLRPLAYPEADVVLACFSVDSPQSLDNLGEKWVPEVRAGCPAAPVVLVATKSDLRKVMGGGYRTWPLHGKVLTEPVEAEVGKTAARRMRAVMYLECSARSGRGVNEVFEFAIRLKLKKAKTSRCLLL